MEKEAEKQYLLEDKDLLDELVKVGPPSTGAAEAGQMHKTCLNSN